MTKSRERRFPNQWACSRTCLCWLLLAGLMSATPLQAAGSIKESEEAIANSLDNRAMLSLERFDSELAAVRAAVARFNPYSIVQDREYLGAIIVQNQVYRYLVARGQSGQDTVTVRLPIPKGARVIAFWHTHGAAGDHRHLFSDTDMQLVKRTGKPFYLADPRGELRVYREGDPALSYGEKRRLGLRGFGRYARGSRVSEQQS